MAKQKEYKGSCYIGVVGGEMENGQCRDSIEAIKKQRYDIGPFYIRATKGYEARQTHFNKWYDGTSKPFMLLLDHDMIFPNNTLEQLRSHKLPYVTGWYPRRTLPTLPVWFDNNEPGVMPMKPSTFIPEDRMIYKLGASGWGCVLIHRDVVTATREILKGEPEVIEDDMDIYPYDLGKIIHSKKILVKSLQGHEYKPNTVQKALVDLLNELRPLRGVKDAVGSDIRFPFYAKLAGFQLYGDSGVRCHHMTSYPIKFEDYAMQSGIQLRGATVAIREDGMKETERLRKAIEG